MKSKRLYDRIRDAVSAPLTIRSLWIIAVLVIVLAAVAIIAHYGLSP